MVTFVLGTVTAVGKYKGDVLTARMNVDTKEVECKYFSSSKEWHKILKGSQFEATFKEHDFTKGESNG